MLDEKSIFKLLDLFMASYGWTYDYAQHFIADTNFDIVTKLSNVLAERQSKDLRLKAYLNGMATGLAFNGKVDDLRKFLSDDEDENEEVLTDEQRENIHKENLRGMWVALKKGSMEEFEKAYAEGKVVI